MLSNFFERIEQFNAMYEMRAIPQNDAPAMLARLEDFGKMLSDESDEANAAVDALEAGDLAGARVMLADWLGDMIVYCASEALRWSIPIERVLQVIMDSNASKLQADGTALFINGKLQKGPNYWKPEPKIGELLK